MDPQHRVTRRRRKPSVARLAHGSSSGSSSLAPGEQGTQCHAGISREVAPCLRLHFLHVVYDHCMDKCESVSHCQVHEEGEIDDGEVDKDFA